MTTRYEIAARHPDGRALLIGYTPRQSRRGPIAAMSKVGPEIIERLPVGEADEISFGTKPRSHARASGWWIGFTGRTQRDAQTEDELPFIAS